MTDDLKARGVRVKALEWVGNFAATPWGGYSIGSAAGPDHSYDWFDWRHSSRGDYDTSEACWATEDEAKIEAQADYESRILSALELDPAALSDHPAVKALVAEAEARAELAVTALHDAYAHQLAACAEWESEMAKARGAAKHKVTAARYAGHYSAMNDLAKRIASLEAAAIRKGETT